MADISLNNLDGIPFGINAGRPANPQPGQPYLNGESNRFELYTQTVGWQNIVQETPSVVNVVGAFNENASSTVTINGTNFAVGAIAYAVGTNGIETAATSTTLVSVVQITANFPALSPLYEPYDIKVVNPSNLYGVLYDSMTVDNVPAWATASGSLGTYIEASSMSVTIAATDAIDTYSSLSYSISSGSLPGGLSINSSTGVISGTPSNITTSTTYNFTASASDGRNPAITRNFSITITDRAPTWVTSTTLPTFSKNISYSTTVSATQDDAGAISYSLFSGSLPTGLSLNSSTGVISGTPSSESLVVFTLRATDNTSATFADRQFTMPNAVPIWSTASSLPSGFTSQSYSQTLVATDDGSITYSVISGSLPNGISLNASSGVISGTPSVAGSFNFTIRATDVNASTTDRAFSISVIAGIYVPASSSISLTSVGQTALSSTFTSIYNSMIDGQGVIIQFDIAGAGGGSGGWDTVNTPTGAAGGRGTVKYLIPRAQLPQLIAVVGQGGGGGLASGGDVANYNYPITSGGAGYAVNRSGGGAGGDGGGFSGIFINNSVSFANVLAITGGGGGGAGSDDNITPGVSGAGGGFNLSGGNGTASSDNLAGGGIGGSISAGGASGSNTNADGSSQPGRQLLGGYGNTNTSTTSMGGAGGGGGGYYGGGGGGTSGGNGSGGGAGGGSGYAANMYSVNIISTSNGSGASGGAGVGSGNGNPGSNGFINISWGYSS
jgi:hypothetical protein